MASHFKGHKVTAILVLVAATAWVATGKFASVGSEEAHAAQPAPEATSIELAQDDGAAPASALRTVAALTPVFQDHAREIRISGVTGADKRTVLAARSDGVIAALPITQGDMVTDDQVVMTVEGADVAAAVMTAEATLAQRTQELEVAEKLFKSGNTAELQLIKVRADKAAAEAALSQAEAAADRLNLRAPFTGIVDKVDVELGEWVQTGTPIATVLSLDPIVVRAEVSEVDIGFVSVNDRAGIRLVNGRQLEGKVRHVAREASTQTRTYPVEVELPNPDGAVPAGMTAEVSLYTRPERAVTVPRSVITLSTQGELGLRIVGPDNVAHFASVELIDDTPEGLVLTGVPEDARIIVLGQDLVRDGETVSVKDAASIALGD
ncbi:efflux RND transporter periplasmic adaptor subunit [Defluviimonas sp. WL0050]|uniref:Efflux RND transporter periplasmic adaptor subunit n=1 Tax=Albidovulum litorale TaxID=2984134 RepID=A0ABT2ZK53_9RHOB|nr:efflux RND transporter periplasmic adaptor subunit [Defluviimonas sp. WL0050]MCV2871496.1 efflux RND transporter periplasmic adaptor subunit [Defluviimonas sp. WL0050]